MSLDFEFVGDARIWQNIRLFVEGKEVHFALVDILHEGDGDFLDVTHHLWGLIEAVDDLV